MSDHRPAVLVVEDEPLIRMGAVSIVEDAGCEALEASHADAAIQILESRSDIRLVLTDVDMPGTMDGLKLAHHISNRWPPIRLIVVSGKLLIEASHLPRGARFFGKPYADTAVSRAVKEMLARP